MLTFLLSEIPGVRGLGLQTAMGVTSALIASMVLLPALLNVLPTPKNISDPEKAGAIGGFLNVLANWVARARRGILITSLVIVGVSIVGATLIEVNTNFIDFFPEKLSNSCQHQRS